jgi:protein SCO1/2
MIWRTSVKRAPVLLCVGMILFSGASFADSSPLFSEPWRWKDEQGQTVTFSRWAGAPLVVTMFFTSCKYRCPRTVDKLHEIEAAFARSHQRAQFVLVTLDPRSDTPQRLDAFKKAAHLPAESWHLLSGDDADTRALGRFLAIHPAYDDGHVDHEVRIGIFDAEGNVVRRLEGWNYDGDEAIR